MKERIKGARLEALDWKLAVAVLICLYASQMVSWIHYMPACFAAILCMQDTVAVSWKTGLNRLILTAVGGLVGIVVLLADSLIGNQWIFLLLAAAGVLVTIIGCKLVRLNYIFIRISCITFLIVIMFNRGSNGLQYAFMRLIGTLFGVLVAVLVTAAFQKLGKKKAAGLDAEKLNAARSANA
ncbi:MAG: hypothetical protein GX096_02500 [Clostridiales bacterium]|nr:hypothetical protein [Clostridiales bacterium]